MRLTITLLVSTLVIIASVPSKASHIWGGELTFEYLQGNQYRVTLGLYVDCEGIIMPTTEDIRIEELGCNGDTVFRSLPLGSTQEITVSCPTILSPCQGGPGGVTYVFFAAYYEYSDTVTIYCDSFRISHEGCCRSPDINTGPENHSYTFYAESFGLGAPVIGPNSSPVFTAPPLISVSSGYEVELDFSAIDRDGDSLVYRIAPVEGIGRVQLPYVSGLVPLDSFTQFDSLSGMVITNQPVAMVGVIRVDVEEYRHTSQGWMQMGRTFRDMQIFFLPIINQVPSISGIDGTSQDVWFAEAGDTISFSISTSDSTVFDSTAIEAIEQPPGSQFNASSGQQFQQGTFQWVTDSTHIQPHPYLLVLKARDHACPGSFVNYKAIKIFVGNPDTTYVWPGDANNDLIANHYDILPIGVAYGASGPARANASTNWVGQPAQNWPQQFATGLNYKFADCNGDGTIDTADVNVVNQNFGLTHNRYNPYARQPASADLWIEIDEDTLQPGDQVTAKLFFGDAQNTLTAYGVAFSLIIDPGIIDATSLDMQFQPNWLAPGGLEFEKQDGNGNLHAALVRTNGQNANGGGTIAELTFTIRPDASITPGTQLPLSFVDVLAIDASEASLNITSGVDEAILDKSTGITRPTFALEITPNPADDQIRISGLVDWDAIEVFNKLGQRMPVAAEQTGNHVLLNTTGLKPGFYIISVQSGDVVKSASVQIQR